MYDDLIATLRCEADLGGPRQKRSLQTRLNIIEAATASFAKHGFDGASTHEIAEAAGVNQGLVTYYFGSKRELWRCVIDQVMSAARNELADGLASLSGVGDREFLRAALIKHVWWSAENANVIRILLDINRSDPESTQWYTERHITPLFNIWSALIADGQAKGIIREGPAINLYYHVISTAFVFAIPNEVKILSGKEADGPPFVQDHADLLVDMLMIGDQAAG